MKSLSFLSLSLVFSTAACSLPSYSPKISKVEYQPADSSSVDMSWEFTYNNNNELTQVDRRVDGTKDFKYSYSYEDGMLVKYKTKSDNSSETIVYERENGYVSKITTNGENTENADYCDTKKLNMSLKNEIDLTWEKGFLTKKEQNLALDGTCQANSQPVTVEYEEDRTIDYRWSEGLLSQKDVDARITINSTYKGDSNKVEQREQIESSFTYKDGVLTELEVSNEKKEGDVRTKSNTDVEFTFNDDGKLVEVDYELRSDGDKVTSNVEIEYNSDGYIYRIEDRDGNRWKITYEEGRISGLIFSLDSAVIGGVTMRLDGNEAHSFEKGNLVDLVGTPVLN